jgi:hypothetical protein
VSQISSLAIVSGLAKTETCAPQIPSELTFSSVQLSGGLTVITATATTIKLEEDSGQSEKEADRQAVDGEQLPTIQASNLVGAGCSVTRS